MANPPRDRVSVLVLNYGADLEQLQRCVESACASSTNDHVSVIEVVIVDNGSSANRDAPDAVAAALRGRSVPVRVSRHSRNWGFAGGINRGIDVLDPSADLVFLLNNDATVEPGCIAETCRVLREQTEDCVSVAPKMMLAGHPHYLDSVGNAVNERGEAFNVGIGQLDVGQYDRVERSFGPCFGGALLRRRAFDPSVVGPLDESFFLYYEDVDWSWRATARGYYSVTAPAAVMHHELSGSTRHLHYAFKFRLQERNLLLTVAKNHEGRAAAGIWRRRIAGHLRGAVTGHYPMASLRASAGALSHLPGALRARREIARRAVNPARTAFAFSAGERPFLDPVTYEPDRSLAAFAHAYRRKAAVTGNERYLLVSQMCDGLIGTSPRALERTDIADRLAPLLEGEPSYVLAELALLRA